MLPTFSFKDGELQIGADRTQWFLAGWPNLKAEASEAGAKRCESRPDFRLFKPREGGGVISHMDGEHKPAHGSGELDDAAQKHAAFEAFRATFPEPVIAAVERFQSHQWNLVDLISRREREALDLAQINPALFFCLGNNDVFREHKHVLRSPAYLAMWLLPEKQRNILEWLGFPATEAMAVCMRKIPPESITTWGGRFFREIVKGSPDVLKLLGHVPVINRSVLQMVYSWRLSEIATPNLLLEVSQLEEDRVYPHVAERLMDAVRLFVEVRKDQRPPKISSVKKIEQFHEEMVREYQQQVERRQERRRLKLERQRKLDELPPPPLPGTADIVPITTVTELKKEGRAMRNCLASYVRRVKSGGCYIYRLLKPERAVFSLIRSGSDWHLGQIEKSSNRNVKLSTVTAVRHWLDRRLLSV
jgi:hypothetical protein